MSALPGADPYLSALPLDPWCHPYVVQSIEDSTTFAITVSSGGPDGVSGDSDDLTNDIGPATPSNVMPAALSEISAIGQAIARMRTDTAVSSPFCLADFSNLTQFAASGNCTPINAPATGLIACNDPLRNFACIECWGGPYLQAVPRDPWCQSYSATEDTSTFAVTVISNGPDEAFGSDDDITYAGGPATQSSGPTTAITDVRNLANAIAQMRTDTTVDVPSCLTDFSNLTLLNASTECTPESVVGALPGCMTVAPGTECWGGPYLYSVTTDPWCNSYMATEDVSTFAVTVISNGLDAVLDTTDDITTTE